MFIASTVDIDLLNAMQSKNGFLTKLKLSRPMLKIPPRRSGDTRIGDLLPKATDSIDKPHLALIGFPSDRGIVLNDGRPGADAGPHALRETLYVFTFFFEVGRDNFESIEAIRTRRFFAFE